MKLNIKGITYSDIYIRLTDEIGSKKKYVRPKCPHGKHKTYCGVCGGGCICKHNKRRSQCADSGGCAICDHNKQKPYCLDCNGSQICKANGPPHNSGCRTRANQILDRFCAHCFANLFPDAPSTLTIGRKYKQLQVVAHIASTYDGFVHDRSLYVDLEGGCASKKRRIDVRKLINNNMLCMEIDEAQRKRYLKQGEEHQYDDLFMYISGKYIFIMYNPDPYKDADDKKRNQKNDTKMALLEQLLNMLTRRINNELNTELVGIHHLCYDKSR